LIWQNIAHDAVVLDELTIGSHATQTSKNCGLNVRVTNELSICTEIAMKAHLINEGDREAQLAGRGPISAVELRQPNLVVADTNIHNGTESNSLPTVEIPLRWAETRMREHISGRANFADSSSRRRHLQIVKHGWISESGFEYGKRAHKRCFHFHAVCVLDLDHENVQRGKLCLVPRQGTGICHSYRWLGLKRGSLITARSCS